jgi:hypothetical protein
VVDAASDANAPTVDDADGEGVPTADTEGDAPVDGDALAGCALPPAQALAGEQGAHVPCEPGQ